MGGLYHSLSEADHLLIGLAETISTGLVANHSEALLQVQFLIMSLRVFQIILESLCDLFGVSRDVSGVFAVGIRPQVGSVFIEVLDRVLGVRGRFPEQR